MNNMPIVFQSAVLSSYAPKIIDYINNHQQDFGNLDKTYWGGRTIHIPQIKNPEIIQLFLEYRKELLDNFYKNSKSSKEIYTDSLHLVRWPVGYELHPHADAENPNGDPHPFPWRDFGTAAFLNEDFDGGELYFPNKNITIKPKVGTVAIFPGTLEYLHGVRSVVSGCRYTIASFLTYDQSHQYIN